jgi:hypothetical protein
VRQTSIARKAAQNGTGLRWYGDDDNGEAWLSRRTSGKRACWASNTAPTCRSSISSGS